MQSSVPKRKFFGGAAGAAGALPGGTAAVSGGGGTTVLSSSESSSSDVVEEVTPLAKPDHVALYIAAKGSTSTVKFLVSDATTFETLLDVVRIKFGIPATEPIDIAVVTSLQPGSEIIGYLSESTIPPMATHKGMLQENMQFSYQVRSVEPTTASSASAPSTPLALSSTPTSGGSPDEADGKKKKTRVKRPKGDGGSTPSSRNSSLKKASLQKDAVLNAAASSDAVPIGGRPRSKGSVSNDADSKDVSASSSVAHSPDKEATAAFKLITLFVPDSKAPRPTPHIIECTPHLRALELLQQLLTTKRVDKKKVDGSWLFEVDEPAGIDRRIADTEIILDLVNSWDAAGLMERKLYLKRDPAGQGSKAARMSFRNIADTLRRVGSKDEREGSTAASPTTAPAGAGSSPAGATAGGGTPSSSKSSANSSPSIFGKALKPRKSTEVGGGVSPLDMARKELEDANSQIEALELALAVANNKLMRLENQKMTEAAASQTAAAALANGGLGGGTSGAMSREALSRQAESQLPRFTPNRPLTEATAAAPPAAPPATAPAATDDTIGHVRLELTVNIPEFGLVGLVDNYWASPGDTVRNIIDRVMGRYGVTDPQHFGLRQLSGATDRWFDDKVIVAQSQSIMKNQLAAERRKGKPKKISEDLATRIRVLGELLGRKPHPGEVELVVPRSGAGSGAETFAGLPLSLAVVQRICDVLERRGLDCEGLFRVSGDHNRMRSLWAVFGSSDAVSLENEPVHNVAGALKLYVRTSKPALIPSASIATLLHLQHVESARILALAESQPGAAVVDDPTLPGNISRALMHGMSAHDFAVLARLIAMLSRVAARADENKMTLSNLGVVFGPALVRTDSSNSVQAMRDAARFGNAAVCTMVHYCREIFGPFCPADFVVKPVEQRGTVGVQAAAAASAAPIEDTSGLDAAMDLHLSAKSAVKGEAEEEEDDDDEDEDDSEDSAV